MDNTIIKQNIKDALRDGDSHYLKELCSTSDYALSYLITVAIKQQDTLNHIKNIITEG